MSHSVSQWLITAFYKWEHLLVNACKSRVSKILKAYRNHSSKRIKHLFLLSRKIIFQNHALWLLWKSRFTRKKIAISNFTGEKRADYESRKYPLPPSTSIRRYWLLNNAWKRKPVFCMLKESSRSSGHCRYPRYYLGQQRFPRVWIDLNCLKNEINDWKPYAGGKNHEKKEMERSTNRVCLMKNSNI